MFATGTCSADSSTSITASPHDRIRVSDPHAVNLVALLAWGAGIGSYLLVINVALWLGGALPSLGASPFVYVGLTQLGRALSR